MNSCLLTVLGREAYILFLKYFITNEKQTCLLWMKNENRACLNVPNNYNMDFFTFQLHSDRHFIEMFISFSFFLTWKSVFEDWNILLPLLIRRDHWILFFIFLGDYSCHHYLAWTGIIPFNIPPTFFFFHETSVVSLNWSAGLSPTDSLWPALWRDYW